MFQGLCQVLAEVGGPGPSCQRECLTKYNVPLTISSYQCTEFVQIPALPPLYDVPVSLGIDLQLYCLPQSQNNNIDSVYLMKNSRKPCFMHECQMRGTVLELGSICVQVDCLDLPPPHHITGIW
jgi:hypothetical protein